ncbi:ArsR/SmtB family transcription factor [Maricaulis sp.]|uniref:ArsR/SmtB family transcription factor n=1 Tax=Maricaulis sp. TaxID=1486257 RepID=UPI003A935C46
MSTDLDSAQPVFRALADPTRCAIVKLLAEQDLRVGDIAAHFAMTRPAVAKHLAVLKSADVIRVSQAGRERINSLNPAALKAASDWLNYFDHFWDDRLAALKSAVEADA